MLSTTQSDIFNPKLNNFNLIRLLAALQVLIIHSHEHLGISESVLIDFISYFPGVPIFFFISGLLITRSCERSKSLRSFYRNRFLRIYPALWVCFILSVIVVLCCYGINASIKDFAIWCFCQLTIVQFYNPEFLRGFGVGTLNGSLWTIPVELQFYFLAPLLVLIRKKINIHYLLVLFIGLSLVYQFYKGDTVLWKLCTVSFIPWFSYFLVGAVFYYNIERIYFFVKGKQVYFLVLYLTAIYFFQQQGITVTGNNINFLLGLILIVFVSSIAFSNNGLSYKLLKDCDISYGVYIYHMISVNVLVHYDIFQNLKGLLIVLIVTLSVSMLSWLFVEKQCLNKKNRKT